MYNGCFMHWLRRRSELGKSNDRRSLESDSSKPVLELWKTLFIQELNDKEIVTDATQEVLIASFYGETRLPDI